MLAVLSSEFIPARTLMTTYSGGKAHNFLVVPFPRYRKELHALISSLCDSLDRTNRESIVAIVVTRFVNVRTEVKAP